MLLIQNGLYADALQLLGSKGGATLALHAREHHSGRTALLLALARPNDGAAVLVAPLVEAGADVGVVDASGDTALMLALRSGQLGLARLLMDNGAQVGAYAWLVHAACLVHLPLGSLLVAWQ
jgi:ankyrin repeat protein